MRNCAWLKYSGDDRGRVVWARRGLMTLQCPKSLITPQSLSLLEQFRIWQEFGGGAAWSLEAKVAEAILVLEQALKMEIEHGEK